MPGPSLDEIRDARARLGDRVLRTPTRPWHDELTQRVFGDESRLWVKLESFQNAGSFKSRGALLAAESLDESARQRGVTAFSAGNHAMAVSYAARAEGVHARVVMPETAEPARIRACREYGADVVLTPTIQDAFDEVRRIESSEGRTFIHPFESTHAVLGSATAGLELIEQAEHLDAVVIPVGGGGLCAGIASALKASGSTCRIYAVEPTGADAMNRSLKAGSPQKLDRVTTIADSLGSPHAAEYTFGLCQQWIDDLVLIEDDQIRSAMRLLFDALKIVAEPAAAAATAAAFGPLRERLRGQRVGLIVCGSNIDVSSFFQHVQSAESLA